MAETADLMRLICGVGCFTSIMLGTVLAMKRNIVNMCVGGYKGEN